MTHSSWHSTSIEVGKLPHPEPSFQSLSPHELYIYNTPIMVVEKQDGPSYSPSSFVNLLEIAICPNPALAPWPHTMQEPAVQCPKLAWLRVLLATGQLGARSIFQLILVSKFQIIKFVPVTDPHPMLTQQTCQRNRWWTQGIFEDWKRHVACKDLSQANSEKWEVDS